MKNSTLTITRDESFIIVQALRTQLNRLRQQAARTEDDTLSRMVSKRADAVHATMQSIIAQNKASV